MRPSPIRSKRLRRGLWAFYEFSKTHPEYFELMFVDRSVPSLSQDFQRFEFFQETTARAEADITACIAAGRFRRRIEPGRGVARPLGRDARRRDDRPGAAPGTRRGSRRAGARPS